MLIGKYYVQIKDVHIHWGERRKTATRQIRKKESYIAIPAGYAYEYNIKIGDVYECLSDSGQVYELKAAGSQSNRDYAKQFQGNGSLKILYDWYELHDAREGDYVVVSIYDNKTIKIEFISGDDNVRLNELNILGENGKIQDAGNIKKDGFRIDSLLVKNEEKEHCNIKFFHDELENKSNGPITSLIIGANGTGKSFVLKILAEIFNALQNVNLLSQMKYSHYELIYAVNGELIQLQILNRKIFIHKNGVLLEKHESSIFPAKALAVSFMLNDKFPFKQIDFDDKIIYEYLGVRMTSNASWTSSMNNKMADTFLSLAVKGKIWEFINKISKFLHIDSKISISFEMAEADFFAEDLKDRLKKYGNSILQQEDFRKNAVRRFKDEVYQELVEFIQGIKRNELYVVNKSKVHFGVSFDTTTSEDEIKKIVNDYKYFKELSNLKVFKNMTLNLFKNGKQYSFEESSSGEKHILYSFTNIYNSIDNNSLILIDEPEISLHPNWQIRYISFLKKVFNNYSSCHFIIASHSHYLVSDLNPDNSSLITVEMDEKGKHFLTLDYSTYAWSAENILYNIFKVRTFRNYYFDLDVRELLHAISHNKRDEMKRIRYLYDKLSKYVLDDKDPLNQIIIEAEEYIKNVESGQSC